MAKEKEVTNSTALVELKDFAVMLPDVNVHEVIASNLGGDSLAISDLDRVKVPAGGGKVWSVPTITGEEDLKELDIVLVHTCLTRAFWEKEFSGENSPPDCYSPDSMTGIGNPGGLCVDCALSKYESGKGKAQACTQKRPLFMLRPDSMLPMVLHVPPTSLGNAKKYLVRLAGAGKSLYSVVTRLTLEKVKSNDGIDYSRIVFAPAQNITGPELTKIEAYVKSIKPFLQKTAEKMAASPNDDTAYDHMDKAA